LGEQKCFFPHKSSEYNRFVPGVRGGGGKGSDPRKKKKKEKKKPRIYFLCDFIKCARPRLSGEKGEEKRGKKKKKASQGGARGVGAFFLLFRSIQPIRWEEETLGGRGKGNFCER